MLRYFINYIILFGLIISIYSCSKTNNVNLLISSDFLKNIDSVKTQTPYQETNIGSGFRLSNLPMRLNNTRDYKDWDEITENFRLESHLHIDTISNLKIIISRGVYKWLYDNEKRINKRISVEEFKNLLVSEGVYSKDFEIKNEIEVEYDGGSKSTNIELWYKGTVNQIKLMEKGIIDINTYLVEQIPYWESKGHHFYY